jgi:hypothetical protein
VFDEIAAKLSSAYDDARSAIITGVRDTVLRTDDAHRVVTALGELSGIAVPAYM